MRFSKKSLTILALLLAPAVSFAAWQIAGYWSTTGMLTVQSEQPIALDCSSDMPTTIDFNGMNQSRNETYTISYTNNNHHSHVYQFDRQINVTDVTGDNCDNTGDISFVCDKTDGQQISLDVGQQDFTTCVLSAIENACPQGAELTTSWELVS